MSAFSEIIGKYIVRVLINADYDTLVFYDNQGIKYIYCAVGDCCNTVWFNHMSGTECFVNQYALDIIAGTLISSVEAKDSVRVSVDEYYTEVVDDSFFTMITDRGFVDFELRNSHNGFYGGNVVFAGNKLEDVDTDVDVSELTEIIKDF